MCDCDDHFPPFSSDNEVVVRVEKIERRSDVVEDREGGKEAGEF